MPTQVIYCHSEDEIILQKSSGQRFLPLAIVMLVSIGFGLLMITYSFSSHDRVSMSRGERVPITQGDVENYLTVVALAVAVSLGMSGSMNAVLDPRSRSYSITSNLLFSSRMVKGPLSDIDAIVIKRVVTDGRNGQVTRLSLRIDWKDPVRSAKSFSVMESSNIYALQNSIEEKLGVHVRWEE